MAPPIRSRTSSFFAFRMPFGNKFASNYFTKLF